MPKELESTMRWTLRKFPVGQTFSSPVKKPDTANVAHDTFKSGLSDMCDMRLRVSCMNDTCNPDKHSTPDQHASMYHTKSVSCMGMVDADEEIEVSTPGIQMDIPEHDQCPDPAYTSVMARKHPLPCSAAAKAALKRMTQSILAQVNHVTGDRDEESILDSFARLAQPTVLAPALTEQEEEPSLSQSRMSYWEMHSTRTHGKRTNEESSMEDIKGYDSVHDIPPVPVHQYQSPVLTEKMVASQVEQVANVKKPTPVAPVLTFQRGNSPSTLYSAQRPVHTQWIPVGDKDRHFDEQQMQPMDASVDIAIQPMDATVIAADIFDGNGAELISTPASDPCFSDDDLDCVSQEKDFPVDTPDAGHTETEPPTSLRASLTAVQNLRAHLLENFVGPKPRAGGGFGEKVQRVGTEVPALGQAGFTVPKTNDYYELLQNRVIEVQQKGKIIRSAVSPPSIASQVEQVANANNVCGPCTTPSKHDLNKAPTVEQPAEHKSVSSQGTFEDALTEQKKHLESLQTKLAKAQLHHPCNGGVETYADKIDGDRAAQLASPSRDASFCDDDPVCVSQEKVSPSPSTPVRVDKQASEARETETEPLTPLRASIAAVQTLQAQLLENVLKDVMDSESDAGGALIDEPQHVGTCPSNKLPDLGEDGFSPPDIDKYNNELMKIGGREAEQDIDIRSGSSSPTSKISTTSMTRYKHDVGELDKSVIRAQEEERQRYEQEESQRLQEERQRHDEEELKQERLRLQRSEEERRTSSNNQPSPQREVEEVLFDSATLSAPEEEQLSTIMTADHIDQHAHLSLESMAPADMGVPEAASRQILRWASAALSDFFTRLPEIVTPSHLLRPRKLRPEVKELLTQCQGISSA